VVHDVLKCRILKQINLYRYPLDILLIVSFTCVHTPSMVFSSMLCRPLTMSVAELLQGAIGIPLVAYDGGARD